ncbi:hypothetical protein C8J57DRAFT_1252140 [Mycena rebaudengoi]|nr:hypothetical protein C8J57DRAFT_1252140 [Mycena rebaudengoi]
MWAGEKKTKKKLKGDAACRRRREAVRGDTKKENGNKRRSAPQNAQRGCREMVHRSEKIGCCAACRRRTQNDVGDSRNTTNRIKKKRGRYSAPRRPEDRRGERQNKTVVGVMAGHRKNDLKNEEMPRMVARPRKIKSNNLRRRCTRQALGDVKIAVRGRQKGSARILNEVWSII